MGRHGHHHSREFRDGKNNEDSDEQHFTMEEAYKTARCLSIDFGSCGYDVEQFRIGMDVELEHGRTNPLTNITNDDMILTGKIALAHLNEFSDYYIRLKRMEKEADKYWRKHRKVVNKHEKKDET